MVAPLLWSSLLVLANPPIGVTVWTGASGNSWNNPSNWSTGLVPTASTDVLVVPAANQPSSFTSNPVCMDLEIQGGASLTLGSGFALTVNGNLTINGSLLVTSASSTATVAGNWTNGGTFASGGATVAFSGSGAIGGASATAFHHLTVSGGVRSSSTAWSLTGDATVAAGATLNLGGFTHSVAGSWNSSAAGATVTGPGTIQFTGPGTTLTGANSIPGMAVSAGARLVDTTTVAGNLSLTGGTLQILPDKTLAVTGNASLTGGTFAGTGGVGAGQILDVAGNVTMGATASPLLGSNTQVRCGGNWSGTAAFDPPNGIVALSGPGPGTASGILNFAQLRIQNGTKTFLAPATVDQSVTVFGGATLDLGSLSHSVAGNWTSNASGASVVGSGTIVFTGTGTTTTGLNSLPNVTVSGGSRLFGSSIVAGNLAASGGTFQILPDSTVSVNGSANFTGGTFAGSGGISTGQILDVAGNVSMAAAASPFLGANTRIHCGGNWTATAAFDPPNGIVVLDGATPAALSGSLNFFSLWIQGGAKTLTAAATVDQDVVVFGGASLSIGSFIHTVGGNWSSDAPGAAVTGPGTIAFNGTGTTQTGANSIPSVSIGIGTRTFATSSIAGDLAVAGGSLSLAPSCVLSVAGSAAFTGGPLTAPTAGATPQILDVAGAVTFSFGTGALAANTEIHCGGNWSASAAFAPTSGLVRLDGPDATVSGTLGFFDLVVAGGPKTLGAPMTVTNDLTVLAGGSLALGAFNHTVRRNWTSSAAGASTSGSGTVTFDLAGTTASGANPTPGVTVAAGARTFATSVVGGNLSVTGGSLTLAPAAVLTVNGNASFTGGPLQAPVAGGSPQILDVSGAVTISVAPGAFAANTEIHCSGNWATTAAFDPAAGLVRLDGAAATISGALTFFNLLVAGGPKTLSSPMLVKGALTVNGGATLNLGAFTHTVQGDWTSSAPGATTTGTGTILFNQAGTTTTGSNAIPSVSVVAGIRTFGTSLVSGALSVTGGALSLGPGAVATVNGNATFTGGSIAAPTAGATPQILDVNGAVTMSVGTGALVPNTEIHCSGAWAATGAFHPIAGVVRLDGAAATISGTLNFFDLVVAGGTKTLAAPVLVENDLTVLGGGGLHLGAFTHTVKGDWTSSAFGASTTGTGTVLFPLTGTTESGANAIPNVSVTGGVRTFGTSLVGGTLTLSGATLSLGPAAVLTVNGTASLASGTFEAPVAGGTPQTLSVAGNVTMSASAGTIAANTQIVCNGSWTATSAFDPAAGTGALGGAGGGTVSGTPIFSNFVVNAGTKTLGAPILVKDSFLILAGANLDFGGFNHVVRNNWFSAGAGSTTPGTGTITFDGTGLTLTGTNPMPNALVTAGQRTLASSTIAGNLSLTGGVLTLLPDALVSVSGNASFTGGILDAPTPPLSSTVLDVEGNVTAITGTGVLAPGTVLRCGGNWSADAAFVPSGGTIELDGSASTLVSSLAPGTDLFFPALVLKNGTRRAGTDLLVHATSIAIQPGGTFDTNGRTVRIAGTPFDISGLLEVDAGSTLALAGTTALTVSPTGTFRAAGTLGSPARVTGENGGGYSFVVDGQIEALDYIFEQMGPAGIVIHSAATIGANPFDLRGGLFQLGSNVPGSALLDIARPAPTQLRYLKFENAGTATFNVRTTSGSPITLVNWGGSFGGPAFENDPGGLITWASPEVTFVSSFVGISGDSLVTVRFTTSAEYDVQTFRVLRSTSPGGPFAEIAGSPIVPLGGPSSGAIYQVLDAGLANGTEYFYRLEQTLTHGETGLLATMDATPLPAVFGNLLKVGPGTFPDIQSALAAAAPGNVVLVATGTYPSFTVTLPVRIRSDGTGPIAIDTTSGPVTVTGVPAVPNGVVLEDLAIGSSATPSIGLLSLGNAGLVLLDNLTVSAGPGFDAIRVDNGPRTAIQGCAISGGTGLRARNGSLVYLSLGSVNSLVAEINSTVRHCQVTPGSTTVQPGSTVQALAGPMPVIGFPKIAELGDLLPITLTGPPSAPFGLRLGTTNGWFDLQGALGLDMIFLLDLLGSFPFGSGSLDAGGTFQLNVPIPVSPAIVGFPFSVQAAVITSVAPLGGRISTRRDLVLLP